MTANSRQLPEALFRFTVENKNYKYRHAKIPESTSKSLKEFLFASLDEVRLYHADQYTNGVLEIRDQGDARHFRQGVLRREASGDVEYQKQRDHAAHTLHNYLLGWYIYENNKLLRNEMCRAVGLRLPPPEGRTPEQYCLKTFSDIWPYLSLLHDIGYLLEGGLRTLNIDLYNEHVKRGAEVICEYFNSRFWSDTPLSSVTERTNARESAGIVEPNFSPFTVTAVGDSLRSIGNLELLCNSVETSLKDRLKGTSKIPRVMFKGKGDAFDVWRQHYQYYSPTMKGRLDNLEKAFYSQIWNGMPGNGIRILDHGVAGGLIQLLYITYYFQMHFGLEEKAKKEPKNEIVKNLMKLVLIRIEEARATYNAYWWWTYGVWATAAAALHNFQQMERPWPGCLNDTGPLALREDPLAYLGILADVLQEWDRYTVSRTSMFTGELPLQGKDVRIWTSNGLVHIEYGDLKRANKVRDALQTALVGWQKIVVVLPIKKANKSRGFSSNKSAKPRSTKEARKKAGRNKQVSNFS